MTLWRRGYDILLSELEDSVRWWLHHLHEFYGTLDKLIERLLESKASVVQSRQIPTIFLFLLLFLFFILLLVTAMKRDIGF